ncbi:hypothetical protein Q9L58_009691 [Maublancomyces gigas]|uniref:Uncharacterized protein n=1 Tax=Discina gigas TaxID=1032678 RepID=A0ABR3G669_9PEZI
MSRFDYFEWVALSKDAKPHLGTQPPPISSPPISSSRLSMLPPPPPVESEFPPRLTTGITRHRSLLTTPHVVPHITRPPQPRPPSFVLKEQWRLRSYRYDQSENIRAGKKADPTADWATVARELGKYVVSTAALDILVMDESTTINFLSPPDPTAEPDHVPYIIATSSTCYTDLNFKENSSTTVTALYTSVLNLNTDSQFRKRPQDESGQFQRKRNKQQPALQDDDTPIEFDG